MEKFLNLVKLNCNIFIQLKGRNYYFKGLLVFKFPDQDFCLFQHFPHNKTIYPRFRSDRSPSCTFKLLSQYQDSTIENKNMQFKFKTVYL
ncbi:hypothetical protein BpHYR1_036598 [Brachionus plicatilis]|uniref:Uncharacterized protein n=1 Tax=Brachionus plicatilis TaxID=10195 RepID=A0A3M7T3I4_BRAPC|nr:hypothetical protein BpHYR1_036598 [Brachionus plicatilis]